MLRDDSYGSCDYYLRNSDGLRKNYLGDSCGLSGIPLGSSEDCLTDSSGFVRVAFRDSQEFPSGFQVVLSGVMRNVGIHLLMM